MSMTKSLARLGAALFLLGDVLCLCAPLSSLGRAWLSPWGILLDPLHLSESSSEMSGLVILILYPLVGALLGAGIGWLIDRLRKRRNAR